MLTGLAFDFEFEELGSEEVDELDVCPPTTEGDVEECPEELECGGWGLAES